jgi:DNA (cytosine-5)-methyltransferase 3A
MGVEPIMINSALVSAQNRVRYYWTNIPGVEQPEQRGIVLRDILETETNENYIETHDTPKQVGTAVDIKGHDQIKRVYSEDGKSSTLTTCGGGHRKPKVLAGAFRGRYEDDGTIKQKLELRQGGKTNSLTTVQKDNVVTETIEVDKEKKQLTIKEATKKGYTTIEDGDCFDMTFPNSKTRRGRNMKDKSNCLTAANYDYMRYEHSDQEQEVYWRKLTPVECERLQTVPDNYTNHVSNTQRYKMLGNGWTIETITHILRNMDLNHE